jgi:hypothetical protein
MEIIRRGSDRVFDSGPLGCCFPVGSNGFRFF